MDDQTDRFLSVLILKSVIKGSEIRLKPSQSLTHTHTLTLTLTNDKDKLRVDLISIIFYLFQVLSCPLISLQCSTFFPNIFLEPRLTSSVNVWSSCPLHELISWRLHTRTLQTRIRAATMRIYNLKQQVCKYWESGWNGEDQMGRERETTKPRSTRQFMSEEERLTIVNVTAGQSGNFSVGWGYGGNDSRQTFAKFRFAISQHPAGVL